MVFGASLPGPDKHGERRHLAPSGPHESLLIDPDGAAGFGVSPIKITVVTKRLRCRCLPASAAVPANMFVTSPGRHQRDWYTWRLMWIDPDVVLATLRHEAFCTELLAF